MMMLRLFFSVFFVLLSLPALAQDPKISFAEARSEYIEDFTGRSLDIVLHISRGGFETEKTIPISALYGRDSEYDLTIKPGSAGSLATDLVNPGFFDLTVPAGARVITLVLGGYHDADKTDDAISISFGTVDMPPEIADLIDFSQGTHRINIVDLRDDAPDTFDQAQPLALGGSTTFHSSDRDQADERLGQDKDCFVFTVPSRGAAEILFSYANLHLHLSSTSFIALFDGNRNLLYKYDDAAALARGDYPEWEESSSSVWTFAPVLDVGDYYLMDTGLGYGLRFASHTPTNDYDTDKDGLIEVSTLSQLDAIRCDLDGDGRVSPKNEAYFGAAFPLYPGGSDYAPIACAGGCRGYELMADLDFEDANNDGTANDASKWAERGTIAEGWRPIGGVYLATFEGNHHVICNLYIRRELETFGNIGLFAEVSGSIQNLGLADVDVRGRGNVGSLAGVSTAHVQGCYVRDGSVEGYGGTSLGGLVGTAGGGRRVVSSYSHVHVLSGLGEGLVAHVGGLVGLLRGGTVIGSYAQGDVIDGLGSVGGLVGTVALPIDSVISSYATGRYFIRADAIVVYFRRDGWPCRQWYWLHSGLLCSSYSWRISRLAL